MKKKLFTFGFIALLFCGFSTEIFAQSRGASVVAQNYDISDNLDLQVVASIFGDSEDLADFERRLNDPSIQVSNLDLNNDGYVDYLRVIEVADDNARVIVIQSVLGQDTFQDVATIELERVQERAVVQDTGRSTTDVHVQIVGNPFLYGPNFIYEPFYWRRPMFFDLMWAPHYSLYYSPWYWGYYPTYFSYWQPMPVFRYRRHITPIIDTRNRYVYSNRRNISRADNIYSRVSRNGYETRNPERSFTNRNGSVTNRRELLDNRDSRTSRLSSESSTRVVNSGVRGTLDSRNTRGNISNTRAAGGERLDRIQSIGNSRLEAPIPSNNRIQRGQFIDRSSTRSSSSFTRTSAPISSSGNYQSVPSSSSSRASSVSNSSNYSRSSGGSISRGSSSPSSSPSRGGGFSGGSSRGGSSRGGSSGGR